MATFDSLIPTLRELPDKTPRRELLPGLRRLPFPWQLLIPIVPFALSPFLFLVVFLATAKPGANYSKHVNAVVVQREVVANAGGTGSVFFKYRFRVAGRNFTDNLLTEPNDKGSELEILQPGDTFRMAYDPRDPNQHTPVVRQTKEDTLWAFIILVFLFFPFMIAFFFVPFLLPLLKAWWLARRLYQNGHLAQGSVLFVHEGGMAFMNQRGGYQVVYNFSDEKGVKHEGRQELNNSWLVGQWHPESPVVVAYDVKKPRQSVILDGFSVARR